MKITLIPVLFLFHASTVFSATPENGVYVLLSSVENNLSAKDILTRFYELPRFVIVDGEITDLRGEFFYPSDCNAVVSGGKARLDLSQAKVQKKEDGLFFVNKELYIDLEQPEFHPTYFPYILPESITAYSLYGRDIVYGVLRFDTPTEAVYSLTSAQAFFTGVGLNVDSCIVRETARLVKIQ